MKKLCANIALAVLCVCLPLPGWSTEFLGRTAGLLEQNLEDGSIAGVGAMTAESPYRGVDNDVLVLPVLIVESKRFFINGIVFGYYFNDVSDSLRFAVIGSPRLQGYDSGDSEDLAGMSDRDWAFDAGVLISWENDVIEMSLEGVSDTTARHEGHEVRVSAAKQLFRGFLKPRVSAAWQSDDLVDYYYGVRPDEARPGRTEYSADDDVEYSAGIRIGLPLGGKWALFGDVECTFPGDEAKDSPIVGDDALMRYLAGLAYRF